MTIILKKTLQQRTKQNKSATAILNFKVGPSLLLKKHNIRLVYIKCKKYNTQFC